jgi:hypothetical protein
VSDVSGCVEQRKDPVLNAVDQALEIVRETLAEMRDGRAAPTFQKEKPSS